MNFTIFLAALSVIFIQVVSLKENYYWREYTGSIPPDAIVGGKDINGDDVYMGQAYIRNEGLIVVQIYRGTKEVLAPINGMKKVDSFIKILCGHQENFYWMVANASDLHLMLIDKHAVIGGHNDGGGLMNIGRISCQGEIKIGKINSFTTEHARFYFNDKGTERSALTYEILLYDNNSTDITP